MAGEDLNVRRADDITGKELPWTALRRACEVEFKYLRSLGVYEKVDERNAIAKYEFKSVANDKWRRHMTRPSSASLGRVGCARQSDG